MIIKKTMRHTVAALAAAALLAGCAGPVQWTQTEQAAVAGTWNAPLPTEQAGAEQQAKNWWQAWNNAQLQALIDRAMLENTDIRKAQAALRAAAALSDAATAELFPTLGLQGSRNKSRISHETVESASGTVTGAWSFSLVGGTFASRQAALNDARASAMTLEDTRIAIAAQVAQTYVSLRLALVQKSISEQTLKNYSEAADIARYRFEAGLIDQSEVDQAQSNLQGARSELPSIELSIAQYRNALARLTTQNVSALEFNEAVEVPRAPQALAVSVPAVTLRQRPDMRSAELAVMAASDRVYAARSQWFPSLSLSGSFGTQAATVSALGVGGTGVAGLVAALSMPLLNWGEQVSATEQAQAKLETARAGYTAVLLAALEEIENALNAIVSAQRRSESLQMAQDYAASAAELAMQNYRAGLVDYQTVLNTQRTLLTARQTRQINEADMAIAMIALYRAMGGGWQESQAGSDADRADTKQLGKEGKHE